MAADLKRTIRKHGLSGTAQEVTDALNLKNIPKTNSERQDLSDLADRYGWEAVTNFQTKLVAAGKQGYLDLLQGGVDLSTQSAYDAVEDMVQAGQITQNEGQNLIKMGRWNASIWQEEGGTGDVLLADVTTALEEIAFEDNAYALADQVDAKVAVIKAKLFDGDITDWAGCVTEFGAE